MTTQPKPERLVGTHWGNFLVGSTGRHLTSVRPVETDRNPSVFGPSLLDATDKRVRVAQPMIRAGWLEDKTTRCRALRGRDHFIPVSWDEALDLAAGELKRVGDAHGNSAIFGGSYGWASAGRFHHAQSQLHRFLNMFGGYTRSVNTYSAAAAEVIVPRIIGMNPLTGLEPNWEDIGRHAELMVAFGGICPRNNQVVPGGIANHTDHDQHLAAVGAGLRIVNVGPSRDDVPAELDPVWVQCRPATDTAMMLGIAHTLLSERLHDAAFLDSHCVGFDIFARYLTGEADGIAKTADWASAICSVPAETMRGLAREMSARKTVITISLSLQRAEHGEQPYWMAIVLAAMLGTIGRRGLGVGFAWGSNGRGYFGPRRINFSWGRFDQGRNAVKDFIPVARIADLLTRPGESFVYDGGTHRYPDIRLVYWAGGNPFHHHQDLNRLDEAWRRPDTVIVNESVWTATARRADIVFPATTFLERNDIVCGLGASITPSRAAIEPFAQSRNDYEILSGLAERLGVREAFTEGRSEMDWLQSIYAESRRNAATSSIELPDFDTFWQGETIDFSGSLSPSPAPLQAFRADPVRNPLPTPSSKIEIWSETIASFNYPDCPGHPVWMAKNEWLGSERARAYPLHMLSPQPGDRLHSQFDFGRASLSGKIQGREAMAINPADAEARGIAHGDVVRIYNDRGALLAGVMVTDGVSLGVIKVATGAWFDPDPSSGIERHGNPNAVSIDVGTSSLAQGPSAQSCLVDVELFEGILPPVQAFVPPPIASVAGRQVDG